jgi:hypothetical protein
MKIKRNKQTNKQTKKLVHTYCTYKKKERDTVVVVGSKTHTNRNRRKKKLKNKKNNIYSNSNIGTV